jgi:hypothetical protein
VTRKKTSQPTSGKLRKQARKFRLSEMYGGGVNGNLLQGRFGTGQIYAWFQKRHRRGIERLKGGVYHSDEETQFGDDHSWKVPSSMIMCLELPLNNSQMNNRLAWYATWISPKTGERLKKYFMSPWQAVHFVATKAQYVDPSAAVVSRTRAYDIPAKYRGKLPHKQEREGKRPLTWYWCPLCMQPRRFRAVRVYGKLQDFHGIVKSWSDEKQTYIPKERKLRLLECSVCECTNRDTIFRRSNQPWEVRKFKKGARRARRRR